MKYYVKLKFAIGESFGLTVEAESAQAAEDRVKALAIACKRTATVVVASVVMA